MAAVVDLAVDDLTRAAEYYESLLAVNICSKDTNGAVLAGDHVEVRLRPAGDGSRSQATLDVTPGMLARILDGAMKVRCTIDVESSTVVRFVDRYDQKWTLACHLT